MAHAANPFEFYETPRTFSRWLFERVRIEGGIAEPCAGSRALVDAGHDPAVRAWVTNDVDTFWRGLDSYMDAADARYWDQVGPLDWVVTNPPFTKAVDILEHALAKTVIGVAMHLRASFHEPLKSGPRRAFLREHPPTGILWLPRYAYQRSPKTGAWTTDSITSCWTIWLHDSAAPRFIEYAPDWVFREIEDETPRYRARMDQIAAARRAAA